MTELKKHQALQDRLLRLFSKRQFGANFFILGAVWAMLFLFIMVVTPSIPIRLSTFALAVLPFAILCITFTLFEYTIKTKVAANDYQIFKTKCTGIKPLLGSVLVEDTEAIHKNLKWPWKSLNFLDGLQHARVGDEIGVIKVNKLAFAFSLNDTVSS